MATDTTAPPVQPAAGQQSLTELVSGILDDGQRLMKQQFEMVRAEFKEDLRKTMTVVQCFAVAAVLGVIGGVMLIIALVELLHELTHLPMSACWGIVGGLALVGAAVAAVIGSRTLAKFNPLPDKSFNALQENVSWVTSPPK